jgi:hypothetical protein
LNALTIRCRVSAVSRLDLLIEVYPYDRESFAF